MFPCRVTVKKNLAEMLLGVPVIQFTSVVHVPGIAGIITMLIWNIHFRGGLAWDSSNKSLIFNVSLSSSLSFCFQFMCSYCYGLENFPIFRDPTTIDSVDFYRFRQFRPFHTDPTHPPLFLFKSDWKEVYTIGWPVWSGFNSMAFYHSQQHTFLPIFPKFIFQLW